ncbi:acetate--CoA ligase [Thioalkalivibrio paradoxus]|uniref:Acetyl-coenzyme A synthetase n=1 Tax=Thioalkalivibrio paradoxus ARh 1 TaxID=713585 RepID=W0DKK9_9GAMM|nr:acetate--CoA ligase [Thioalkalivibrio paradoxus]AHE98996.1 acetyl-CoA synthetase [Thioalkalivibrio paradoxus ARh 1]
MSDTIESALHENRHFPPPADFVANARLKPEEAEALYRKAEEDHEGFWCDLAREKITWHREFSVGLDDSQAPHYAWFTDGRMNVSYNCIDRHLDTRGDKPAIIFEGENGDTRTYTYRDLYHEVGKLANGLRASGVRKGDRVVIYMPMIAEAVIAMQACARIGAVHSVVFGGFSADALRDRIDNSGAEVMITADGGTRGGRVVSLKKTADKALDICSGTVRKVIVCKRAGNEVNMTEGRDVWWQDLVADQPVDCEPEWVESEHPLFLLYTSGSTGKPKGIQHASAGYLLNTIITNEWVFDLHDEDIFWCTADVGWITGHSYVAYGPLAVGATQVVYEGVPTVPDGGRWWQMCQAHGVTVFYTAPTAIRALMKLGDEIPAEYDLSKLRLLGTVGEPINPEAWMWYYRTIGGERCPIVDTWWQTETGAHMIAPLPSVTTLTPGSCTRPLPGIVADVVNEEGESLGPDQGGFLVIKKPWPSMLRTVWQDDHRYKSTYWPKFDGKYYLAGDSARRDPDGNFWIMGRIDDVLNVSGHRLGTMEIESALVAHEAVAEAAVVGRPHDVKGEAIVAFVILKGERPTGAAAEEMVKALREWVSEHIGPIAKPDDIRFADGLPKTRSGKIMRRLLRSIAKGEEITSDTSTLENEAVVAQLQGKA